jgi:CheY-like chemotaxis protein
MEKGQQVVLLVEDSLVVREMTRAVLEQAGYRVRAVAGNADLEDRIAADPGFLSGIDLMVLDMELIEELERQRDDKGGSHAGAAMTGSQLGAFLPMAHPQLGDVPFLVYSGKEQDEIQDHLEELEAFAASDERIRNNYRGFVAKQEDAGAGLLESIAGILAPPGG